MTKLNEQEDVIEELPEIVEGEEDNTDWKALAQKNQGIAKRFKTKLEKAKDKETKPKVKKLKSKGTDKLDYAEKAFLISNGIKGTEEHQLAIDTMKNSGKDLDEVIESKFFMSELKDLRDKAAKDDATPPSSSGRASASPKTDVDYWIAKGTLPPEDQTELRQKVVNARMKSQDGGSPFSKNPVVGGSKR